MSARKPDPLQELFQEAQTLTLKIEEVNKMIEVGRNAYMSTRLPYPRDVLATQEETRTIREEYHNTLYSQTLIQRRKHMQMLLTNLIGRIGETAYGKA
jgi:hypothetical protein